MKNGKRPRMYEKILLKQNGHDPYSYLRVKRENRKYTFINKNTGKILVIEDCNGK